MIRPTLFAAALAVTMTLTGCSGRDVDSPSQSDATDVPASRGAARPPMALFTSLPIYWGEGDVTDLLSQDGAPHWVRTRLERSFVVAPIDDLTRLPGTQRLIMAQPRALSPAENVALDSWVRGGGRLLLFVDPMLMAHSQYGLGDRRRPEAIAMLAPILARWGLSLVPDEMREGRSDIDSGAGVPIPVEDAGRLDVTGDGHESDCTVGMGGLVADCTIGNGRVTILADATMLQDGDDAGPHAPAALDSLLRRAFGPDA